MRRGEGLREIKRCQHEPCDKQAGHFFKILTGRASEGGMKYVEAGGSSASASSVL
jgi:hypothetical protein